MSRKKKPVSFSVIGGGDNNPLLLVLRSAASFRQDGFWSLSLYFFL